MNLRKKILLASALPLLLFCLCFSGLPGIAGKASADLKLSNSQDDQKVKDFCKSHLPSGASRLDKGACYEGYVLGYNNRNDSACDSDYQGHSSAIHYCKTVGYNGGVHNLAHITEPRGGGGGGGGGGVAAGSADTCGDSPGIGISIAVGCRGKGNPIADMAFAVIRVLSAGVGLVVVGSIVVGGVQYSASRGDPQATALAINRIRSSLFALLIYIFGFALLNYIIPGAVLQ
jgi:hypothetical protein